MNSCPAPTILFLLVYLMSWSILKAQLSDTAALTPPDFELMRDQEDYRYLGRKAGKKSFWESAKYLPLGAGSFLSFGADARAELQLLRNQDWTDGRHDQPLFLRLMLHTDWHISSRLRLFGQLKSGHAPGQNGPPVPLFVDRLDVHQLFGVWTFGASRIEIGRRELSYGSSRLISIREGTNVRQSFDGIRWIREYPKARFDLLCYFYNPQRTGFFDNHFATDQLVWGVYYVREFGIKQSLNMDLYYLGIRNRHPLFAEGSQREIRHSFGIRHWGKTAGLRYNNEAVGQWGAFGSGRIRAWTLSSELYFSIQGRLQLTPGLKAEIISGDRIAGDGHLQTFNALYPRGGYFGLLAVIGPANLIDVHPSLSLEPKRGLRVKMDWDFFWRHQLADGIYFPSARLNLPGNNSTERFIGHQAGVQLTLTVNRFVAWEASYFHFFAGPFLKDVTEGAGFSQFGTSVSCKF